MKNKKSPSTWFERIWECTGLVNSNPELAPYWDLDKSPQYQVNVMAKLIGQGLPLTPPKTLKVITPGKLGLLLGQQCASLYALGEYLSVGNNPEAVKRGEENLKFLETQTDVPGVTSALHGVWIAVLMIQELVKNCPRFEKTVHSAFKAALDQPNYQEAVEFFRGFAKGMTKPGLKDGQLIGRTDASILLTKFFVHRDEISKMKTVAELRSFLLKNGFTEQTLGDDSRLQKLCHRLGYAPGRRGRPPKKNK
jgi:hypothetical protein